MKRLDQEYEQLSKALAAVNRFIRVERKMRYQHTEAEHKALSKERGDCIDILMGSDNMVAQAIALKFQTGCGSSLYGVKELINRLVNLCVSPDTSHS